MSQMHLACNVVVYGQTERFDTPLVDPARLMRSDTLSQAAACDGTAVGRHEPAPQSQSAVSIPRLPPLVAIWPSENERVMSGKVAILPSEVEPKTSVWSTSFNSLEFAISKV